MNTARLWRQGRDQLAAWLPVLVMMLFALGSWWLVRSAPRFGPEGGGPPPSAEPDYFMREFSVRSFDADGRLKSEIVGSEGQHFPLTDTLEVQQPRIRSYDEQGNPTVATARRAVAKGDGSEAELFDNARVVREAVTRPRGGDLPRMEFLGAYLHALSTRIASAPTSRWSCAAAPTSSPATASPTTTAAAWPCSPGRCGACCSRDADPAPRPPWQG